MSIYTEKSFFLSFNIYRIITIILLSSKNVRNFPKNVRDPRSQYPAFQKLRDSVNNFPYFIDQLSKCSQEILFTRQGEALFFRKSVSDSLWNEGGGSHSLILELPTKVSFQNVLCMLEGANKPVYFLPFLVMAQCQGRFIIYAVKAVWKRRNKRRKTANQNLHGDSKLRY